MLELHIFEVATVRDNNAPIPAYLITLPDGRRWLVDTGCLADMIDAPDAPFTVTRSSHIVGQLASLSLSPTDIDTVIVSHLDPDHAGAHDEFPHAEFVIQAAHHRHATESVLLRYEWMRPHWEKSRWRLVEGDVELAEGVTVIECGGHVPGHQAVLVDLPNTGPVLLAGDAWMRDTDPETRPMTPHDLDERETRASQRKLMRLAADRKAALVIHNHDAEQWHTLDRHYT